MPIGGYRLAVTWIICILDVANLQHILKIR